VRSEADVAHEAVLVMNPFTGPALNEVFDRVVALIRERDEANEAIEVARNVIAERVRERDALRVERDAYKKAKAENDERFMLERDEARAEVARLREALQRAANHACPFHVDGIACGGCGTCQARAALASSKDTET